MVLYIYIMYKETISKIAVKIVFPVMQSYCENRNVS